VETLGRLVAADEPAATIAADMRARRDAVVAAVAAASRPRVYEELDASDPARPFAAAPHGFYGELLELAGGTNIFADLAGDVGQVDTETIVARDPEIIVLTDADVPFNPQTPEMVAARPGWNVVSAVQSGAVHAVPGALVSTPGPRLADGLEALARVLHPEVFPTPPAAAVLAAAH
jgi:iron complex transport system substrate-binding protein